jgi:formylglycine-generating enzyme required for sulfatase activity
VGFLGLLGAALALAWSGEPVAVVENNAPGQEPEPVYTSRFVDLVPLPGGRFLMGSRETEEGYLPAERPIREVSLSSFTCMRYPVTRRLYAEITGSDPGWPEGKADDRPINNISWFDAVTFCNHLSERRGLALCYRIDGEEVTWDRTANGYRLLTEAEWEYACRAGSTTHFSFGDDPRSLAEHAWFYENSRRRPQPVGQRIPNTWGLHDMHGNVYEWCWDWFGSYSGKDLMDPIGPPEGTVRVLRGGAFNDPPRFLRSSDRYRFHPSVRNRLFGFRCARGASPP